MNKDILERAERIERLAKEMIKIAGEIKRDLKAPAGMLGREDGKVNEIEGMGYWRPTNNIK